MASTFSSIGRKIFGSKNDREVKRLRPYVDEINGLEPEFQKLSDDELRAKVAEWRATLSAIEDRELQNEKLQDLLPPVFAAQNRTNRRILQLHDVWHLFAGFGFTAQGEVAISGFQLAQFGQNYSTRFLAATTTMMCLRPVVDIDQFISLISEGWRHGRRAPPLMSVEWHKMLGRSIADLRAEMHVAPFKSRTPELLNF